MNLASSETATSNQVFSYPSNKQSSYQMELDHGRQEQQSSTTTNESSTTGQSYTSIHPTALPSLSSLSLSNQYPSFKKGDTNNEQKSVPILNPTPIHNTYPVFSNSPLVRSMSPSLQQQQQQQQPQGPGYHAVHRFAPIYSYNQPSNMMNNNNSTNAPTSQVFSAPPYYAPPPPFYYPPMPYPIHESASPPLLFATTGSPMLSSPSIRSSSPDKSANNSGTSGSVTANSSVAKPPHPNSKRKKKLSKDEILKYIQYPQPDAARMLNVSVSTLKRRFYELGLGRWPYPTTHLPSQSGVFPRSGTSSGNNSNRSSGKFEPISMDDESSQPMDSDQSTTSAEDEDDSMGSAENAKESNSALNPGTTEANQQNTSGILLSSSANPRETLLNRDPLRVSPNQPPLFIHSNIIANNQQHTYKDGGSTTANILQVIHKTNNNSSDALKNKITQSEILKKKFGDVVRLQTEGESEKSSTLENLQQAFSQPEVATPRTKVSINWLANDKTGVTTPEAKMVNRETIEALKNSF